MYECKECGYKTEETQNMKECPVCNKPMEESGKKKDVKKAFSVKRILITFLAILIGRFAGSYLAGKVFEKHEADSVQKDMEAFIRKVEAYIPGEMSGDGYRSEFWGISFTPDENWVEMEETEIAETERGLEQSGKEAAIREVKNAGMEGELLQKYEETMYFNVEAGYNCIMDDIYTGELIFYSYSAYGAEQSSDMDEEILQGVAAELTDVKQGEAYFGSTKYKYIDGIVTEDGFTVRERIYIKSKGVMINMVFLTYIEEYGEVLESFESGLSVCN